MKDIQKERKEEELRLAYESNYEALKGEADIWEAASLENLTQLPKYSSLKQRYSDK